MKGRRAEDQEQDQDQDLSFLHSWLVEQLLDPKLLVLLFFKATPKLARGHALGRWLGIRPFQPRTVMVRGRKPKHAHCIGKDNGHAHDRLPLRGASAGAA